MGEKTLTDEVRRSTEKTRAAVVAIWEKYSGTLFERVALLERATSALREGSLSEELRRDAEMEAHKLAGSLGTFGLPEGSKLAGEIEMIFQPEGPRNHVEKHRLSELLGSLRKELERGPAGAG